MLSARLCSASATEAIVKAGGSVLGSVSHPLGATDFGSYLLQAQASGAKVIALADTGADAINAIRQAGGIPDCRT